MLDTTKYDAFGLLGGDPRPADVSCLRASVVSAQGVYYYFTQRIYQS